MSRHGPGPSSTYLQAFRHRVQESPEKLAFTFLADGEAIAERLTYAELDLRARSLGAMLVRHGLEGQRALLLYPPGLEFVVGFFGCLYAGVVAVPAYPLLRRRHVGKLLSLATDSGAAAVLTDAAGRRRMSKLTADQRKLQELLWLATDQPETWAIRGESQLDLAAAWRLPEIDEGSLALLQYTSGSTREPRGVSVTHGNLVANQRAIQQAFGETQESVVVGWLPLYHDMGLIGNVLQPPFIGARCVLMSPTAFLQQPYRWLRAISDFRGTTSGGPNFAYDLCLRKIPAERRQELDLSSWQVAFNGAEPVAPETLDGFAAGFAASGFRRTAFYPCYGLAEATLFVTGGERSAPPTFQEVDGEALLLHRIEAVEEGGRRLVSSGRPASEVEILVADPVSLRPAPPGRIGELWLRGPTVASGYWNRPRETEEVFGARIAPSQQGPYLRTGDLGFVQDGEVFVTGRMKDLIILRGRNHYPQDLEACAEASHPSLRRGGAAAFSLETDGGEGAVVVQEVEHRCSQEEAAEAMSSLRQAILEEHEVRLHGVALIRAGGLPKTSSGKVRRQPCKTLYLAGKLPVVVEWRQGEEMERNRDWLEEAPTEPGEVEGWLVSQLAAWCGEEEQDVSLDEPVSRFGLDSLSAVGLAHALETGLGVPMPGTLLLEDHTVSEVAVRIRQLCQAHQGEAGDGPEPPPAETEEATGILSPGQRALLLQQELADRSPVNNLAGAFQILGDLDEEALRRALVALGHRHEALRTTFPKGSSEGRPEERTRRQVAEAPELALDSADASTWGEEELQARLTEEAHRPLDHRRGPLFRLVVFRRKQPGAVLLLVIHHLVADLWSLAILLEDLGDLYARAAQGEDLATEEDGASATYGQYVRWQENLLKGPAGDRLRSYWQQTLEPLPPLLDLPTDRPRPPRRSFRGGLARLALPADLSSELPRLARRSSSTLFPLLLAALQTLLYRYSGERSFVVGTPATGRSRQAFAGSVGYFVNLLPLPADLDGRAPFESALREARRSVLSAVEHQDYPLPKILEDLKIEREPGRSPLFDVVLVLQQPPPGSSVDPTSLALDHGGTGFSWGGLDVETRCVGRRSAQFDLTLTAGEVDGQLLTTLQFDAELYDRPTAERFLLHFRTLLQGIAEAPGQSLSELPFLSLGERRQIIGEWSAPRAEPAAPSCLHSIFEAQVRQRPDAVAVTDAAGSWTYRELDRRAGFLARHLQSLGIGPESPVVLHLGRSRELVSVVLGVLKAGGAYVPVDPSYPAERLRFVLEDTGAAVLLTDRPVPAELLADLGTEAVTVKDALREAREGLEVDPAFLSPPVSGSQTAYVIYTSGSTGTPKGVAIPHGNVARLFTATQPWFGFGPGEAWTLFHSSAFDFSVWELWGPLLHGGRLVVVDEATSRSPAELLALLRRESVTVLNQTPTALRGLVAEAVAGRDRAPLPALRWIVLGGEALDVGTLAPWFEAFGDRQPCIVNMYGITETTVHVTYRPMEAADLKPERSGLEGSPIGIPIPDLGVYVLDPRLRPVPPGVTGELVVSGAGLARGYVGRPALTAERFVPDPYSSSPGGRLYRSGDLGRHRPNGSLRYLRRGDQQVKLRGFRIEPGEIETALRRHRAVTDAVVVAHWPKEKARKLVTGSEARLISADPNGDSAEDGDLRSFLKGDEGRGTSEPQLVAYWIPDATEPPPTVTELRRFLGELLPKHMVPASFVALEALPLTVNGKLDRAALPDPDRSRPDLEESYTPPETPLEQKLALDWAQVLGLDRVGIDDNLFELGGDSIRSLEIVARGEERGLAFTLQQLYELQTVRRLAASLEVDRQAPASTAGGPTEPFALVSAEDRERLPAEIEDAYPLARIQAGVIFHSQGAPDCPMYHDIFYYHLRARFDRALLEEAVSDVVRLHPILRTAFDLTSYREPLQLVYRRVEVPVAVVDLRSLAPAEQQRAQEVWRAREKERPFVWEEAPLIRFFVHRLEDDVFHLVLSFHDAILDGWSTASLLTAVLRRYDRLVTGLPLEEEPPTAVGFRDFVAAERDAIASPEHQAFWEDFLAGARPTPLPGPPAAASTAAKEGAAPDIWVLDAALPEKLSAGLLTVARRAEVPVKHVLLAAHFRALGHLTGERDVLTGVEANGRLEEADGQRVLGIHLNSLPYRLRLPRGSWIDLVQKTFATEQALLPFRRYPLAELQKARRGEPLFETVFNYTHFHVFQGLEGCRGIEVLGARGFGQTHFTLRVELNRDPFSDRFHLDFEGDLHRISKARMRATAGVYRRVLEAMVEDPESRHDLCGLLSPAQERELRVESAGPPLPSPAAPTLHDLIALQARLRPDAPAVACGEAVYSYRRLDDASSLLARRLRALGVESGARVALASERSAEVVLGILATLRAGAAYVVLDPELPPERQAFLLEDCAPTLLLVQPSLEDRLPSSELPRVSLTWPEEEEVLAQSTTGTPDLPSVPPEGPAYVIYTSGSTGVPKGVEVSHRNLVGSTTARDVFYDSLPESFLLISPFGFDSSVAGLFWTLSTGGKLVVPEPREAKDPVALGKLAGRHGVTHLLAIPAFCSLLLHHAPEGSLSSLRTVIAAGEACPPSLAAQVRQRLPRAELVNEYGPTEGTVWSCAFRCGMTWGEMAPETVVPVGRAIAGCRLHLLDWALLPVPPGAAGELYLAGEGVARGYLGRPRETAEAFLPNPYGQRPGERLYRTGDRMRRGRTGELEFLGRVDGQVKLRGHRIEVGEIEARLEEMESVAEAAAVVRDDGPAGPCLVAYVTPRNGRAADGDAMKDRLRKTLPPSMVPAFFVVLDTLPRNANGKLDRCKLPEPAWERPDMKEIEEFLAQLEELTEDEARALRSAQVGGTRAGREGP